jgi:hypothetical protein
LERIKAAKANNKKEAISSSSSVDKGTRHTWIQYTRDKDGAQYYHNSETQETSWDKPEGVGISNEDKQRVIKRRGSALSGRLQRMKALKARRQSLSRSETIQ